MSPQDFTYWLQGFSEIHGKAPTQKQWLIIQDHLQLVFKKETPNYGAKTIFSSSSPNLDFSGLSGFNHSLNSNLNLPPGVAC
jgi:hypothetical protein